MSRKNAKVGTISPFNTGRFNRAILGGSISAQPDLTNRKELTTGRLAIVATTMLNPTIFSPSASVTPKTISRKMHKTGELAVFNKAALNPAIFGQPAFIGSVVVNAYALDCAINQGIATGSRLMGEELKTLPMKVVSGADRSNSPHLGLAPTSVGSRRPRPYPILIKYPSNDGGYILFAGGDLVDAAQNSGAAELKCMVIPYAQAMAVGRKFIDGFVLPRHGQETLVQTTPPMESPTQKVTGHDDTEKSLHKDGEASAAASVGRPAVSQMTADPALIPVGHQLAARAIHEAKVVDGEVVVRAQESIASPTAKAMLERANGQAFDIIIEHRPLGTGRWGMSLNELAVCMFIRHLFSRVKAMAVDNTTNKAGHTITQEKIGTNGPGMPMDLQDWLDRHSSLRQCRNNFWTASIPDALFRACTALRYGVAEPSPKNLSDFLFDLIRAAFKTLELAKRQASNLHELNGINSSAKDRPPKADWGLIINTSVDGISDRKVGELYEVDELVRLMLAVLGRVNAAKIWRDEGERTLEYQWLVAIGDLVRTRKMIVTCLMAQEFVHVEIDRGAGRARDAGWQVFDAALAIACKDRCSLPEARRELGLICEEAMVNSCGMIVSYSRNGRSSLVGEPLDLAASTAAEVPNLLF